MPSIRASRSVMPLIAAAVAVCAELAAALSSASIRPTRYETTTAAPIRDMMTPTPAITAAHACGDTLAATLAVRGARNDRDGQRARRRAHALD